MKRLIHTLLILFSLLWSAESWAYGETTSYVLYDTGNEYELRTISTGPTFTLSGPGQTLTFEARRQTLSVNYFFVQTSEDGSTWSDFQNPSLSTSFKTYTYELNNTNIRYIRFLTKTRATLTKYYRNIKVTRATTLSTAVSTLDFGEVRKNVKKSLTVDVNYNNTTYNQQITGSCTNSCFTVTSVDVGETGTQSVAINFTPTSAGVHTGTVTLSMNGKTVSFTVTGTGLTTYYTQATAQSTSGGTATVSFDAFDSATETTVTANSGWVSAANGSASAYYKAVGQEGYTFLGWKAALSDASYLSTEAEFLDSYSYDSQDASNPTLRTRLAVFAPEFYFAASTGVNDAEHGSATVSLASSHIQGEPNATSASTTATFTATVSDEEYDFAGWGTSVDATNPVSTANPYTATLTNSTPGSTETLNLYALFKKVKVTLDPSDPTYIAGTYKTVTLARTLKQGYNTIALPLNTDVEALTGRSNADDWVAQLTTVTLNEQDGYTLYFTKVTDGAIVANQPYVLYLGEEVVNPSWTNSTVVAAANESVTPTNGYSGYTDWQMTSNFVSSFAMTGKYGIVNSLGALQLGGEGSYLNAFTAYISYSGSNNAPRLRVAYIDVDGTVDFVNSLPSETSDTPAAIYGLDGIKRSALGHGINIVRMPDGSVRKIKQ